METITPNEDVWASEHREYVSEKIRKANEYLGDVSSLLESYVITGQRYYYREAQSLIEHIANEMARGGLNRTTEIAYFVCERCDSDICEHANKYN